MEKEKSSVNLGGKIGAALSVVVFLILFFMPEVPGLDPIGQKAIAVFMGALVLWVSRPIPIYLTSIIVVLLLPLLGIVEDQEVAFGTLGYDIIWLMVSAFVLTSAMSKSNLGNRIALTLVTKLGKTPKQTLAVLVLVNIFLAFFVPSTTARASLIVPIALVLLEVYKAVPGKSNFGKLMMLQGVQNNAFATSMIMTATSAQVLAVGFINQHTGSNIGYMEWLLSSVPQALLTIILTFLIGIKLYKFDKEITTDGSSQVRDILKAELDKLGKMSGEEKRATFIFLLTLFLWATGNYHEQMFGFEISTEQTAVIAMLLCFMPGIVVLTWKEANIKWDLMLFSAGAYAAGNALNDSGGATFLIEKLIDAIGLNNMSHGVIAVVLIFISVFSHLIFTSKTVRTTIMIPAVLNIATGLGMDPVKLALACSLGIAYTVTLPPHSKVNTLYFGTGYFDVKDELIFGLIACFVGSAAICLGYFTWIGAIV
ncbi:MAG: DASS family sodium-coupled anion symporter [Clostridiales bacterium]|nr:DASS family sodium-coupled anion symporter [Clostridiales bacterium]